MSPTQRESRGAGATDQAGDLAGHLAGEITALDSELTEIAMLVAQAQSEATRHEQRRVQTTEKLASAVNLPPADTAALNTQLVALTRRAAVMEAQVDVLEGKRRTLTRFRDSLMELAQAYGGAPPGSADGPVGRGVARIGAGEGAGSPMSRIVLNAQEDLRREIARAMHDGPAQSLTNIVLQAQIVERLLGRDADGARGELRLLVSMVQQTLDATKSFIFDVRPMVLDDLGLVPTLRRAARERGRRASISVEFDSIGADRRIDVDLESSLFRIIDEALTGYLAGRPDRIAIRLEWSDDAVEATINADRDPTKQMADADQEVAAASEAIAATDKDLPPALESMMADRRERAGVKSAAAREAAIVSLPESTWREIQQRATTTGIVAELSDGGGTLHVRADLGTVADAADEPA
ncbi:MAG: two-component system, NarL family, sensor histidine kinase DegS [Chloroflexota bacterium]|nr:two-component system, NarL family, sensor histidine kinase DegS [Chloroflexota bacterium]